MENIEWEFKKNAKPYETCDDFYYELTLGRDAKSVLEKLIKNKEQLAKVLDALDVIQDLQNSLLDAGLWEEG